MNVDYVSVARARRLTALRVLDRRQPDLPGMAKPKMAPHPDQVTERLVYVLKPRESAKT